MIEEYTSAGKQIICFPVVGNFPERGCFGDGIRAARSEGCPKGRLFGNWTSYSNGEYYRGWVKVEVYIMN